MRLRQKISASLLAGVERVDSAGQRLVALRGSGERQADGELHQRAPAVRSRGHGDDVPAPLQSFQASEPLRVWWSVAPLLRVNWAFFRSWSIEAEGSHEKAKALLDKYAVIRPPMKGAFDRLGDVPVDIEPIFPLANESAKADGRK